MIIIKTDKNRFSHWGRPEIINLIKTKTIILSKLNLSYFCFKEMNPVLCLDAQETYLTTGAERWQFETLHFHNSLPKLVTFLPLITGNYWLLGGSVVKPITSFYEEFTTNYLRKTLTKAVSYLSQWIRFWIHSL